MPNINKNYEKEISKNCEDRKENKAGAQDSKNFQHMSSITLEDALEVFDCPNLLKDLDNSLEMARKDETKKEVHEQYCNEVDKKLQRLSLQFHSDRVRNKGGTEAEIAAAEETQKVLNAVRAVIQNLNEHFCNDIDVEYGYSFYSKMAISLLNNDKELEQMNFKILTKLSGLAEIKQEGIIANINKFIKSSQTSMASFVLNNFDEFRRAKDRAIYYLGNCVCRYDEFVRELQLIEKDCCKDQGLESMRLSIIEMLREAQGQANILKKLKEFSVEQSQRKWQLFNLNSEENVDEYLVLPFVEYINVLLMCSNVRRKEIDERSLPLYVRMLDRISSVVQEWVFGSNYEREEVYEIEKENIQQDLYRKSYYLMRYLDKDNEHEEIVANFLKMRKSGLNKEVVMSAFTETMKVYKDYLANKFKPEYYVEGGIRKQMRELYRHMKIVDELIKKTKQDLIYIDQTSAYADNIIASAVKQERQTDEAINFLEGLLSNTEMSMKIKQKKENTVESSHDVINQEPSTSQRKIISQEDSKQGPISVDKIVADAEKRGEQTDKVISSLKKVMVHNTEASIKIKQKKNEHSRKQSS